MRESCIVTPTILVGKQEVPSKLFTELASYTGNREAAKELWSLALIPEFTESLDLEYENGEPTFESFSRAIDIKGYLNGDISLNAARKEAGATNENGETIEYSDALNAIDNAVAFNLSNTNKVATVKKANGKYVISVDKKTAANVDASNKVVFNNSLNNKCLGILRAAGFDVRVDESSPYAGVFNPLDAVPTADGLRTVIQIAKGERGELAFPEEFAHVMIAGLSNNPLVIRLLDSMTPTAILEILGELYEQYYSKYNGDELMLKKEAAGKLLKRHIVGESVQPQQKNLITRLWNWIVDRLKGIKESSIDDAIDQANKEAGELAELIMSGGAVVDEELIMAEKPLYDLEDEVVGMEKIALEALKVMSKRLKILSLRSKSGRYSDEDVKAIKELQELIEKKKYAESSLSFLAESLGQIEELLKELKRLKSSDVRSESDLGKIRKTSFALRSIKEFSDAYEPIIRLMMSLPAMLERGEVELTEEDAEKIADEATKAFRIINNINSNYNNLRFDTVFNFLKTYWGKDKVVEMGKNKGETITLEMIMKTASKDINGLDRWISSLADASDPMLSLVSKAVKMAHIRRDSLLTKIAAGIRAAHKKLVQAGYNTEFMFEKDSNGKLTGRLISDIDFARFNSERNEFIKSLEEEGHPKYVIKSKVEAWERRHMASYPVEGSATGRTEVLPSKTIYGLPSVESRLAPAQYEYYKTMMEAKALLEDLIPERYTNTYNAILISKDMTLAIGENMGNPKKALSLIKERMKSKFLRRADDVGFGEEEIDGDTQKVLLDFAGKPVEKLPVYYTSPLEHTEMLSTDFTASMMAYAGMAVNYGEMNKVIDVLELTRDLIKDREVQLMSGDKKLVESFKALHKNFSSAYTKPGDKTNIGARIDDYYASVIYDKQKKDEGTLMGTKLDLAKTLDALKEYTGQVGLGLNLFAAMSNVTVGKIQMFIESLGGEYFGIKNAAIGKKNYYKDLPAYLAEVNSTLKKSKMGLLIEKFDALEEFYSNLLNDGYYKGPLSRIIGNSNLFILNNMGEHYLHTRTMLAMLDAYKVKDGGTTRSLYDVMEVVDEDGEYSIKIKDGVTKLDGSAITEDDLNNLRLKIGRVNQSMNGAFNEDDRGAIHRYALGRLAMLFRQWMPAHYYRRFAMPYYDAALDQWREGFYITAGKFLLDTLKDLSRAKFLLATRWNELSEHEKANLRRAMAELSMWGMLTTSIILMGPEKDKKGVWYDRMIIYQLKRMKLEVGASVPIDPSFVRNIFTILLSPSASINSVNNLMDCLEFWNMFHELESGRYKGWTEWERDVTQVWPIYGLVRRAIDLTNEDYMFTILNK